MNGRSRARVGSWTWLFLVDPCIGKSMSDLPVNESRSLSLGRSVLGLRPESPLACVGVVTKECVSKLYIFGCNVGMGETLLVLRQSCTRYEYLVSV